MFAVTPVMHDGESIFLVDIGVYFDKTFVDRAKSRFGVDLVIHPFNGEIFTTLSSTIGDTVVATPEKLKGAFEGAIVRRAVTVSDHAASIYLGQIKHYADQPVAVVEPIKDTTDYESAAASAQRTLILATTIIILAGAFLAFLLARGLIRPLSAISTTMNRPSSGDTAVTIPGIQRRDELGAMANAVQVFKDNMIETERLKLETEVNRNSAEA